MLVSMSDDCCECVMTLTLTFREHQRVTRTGRVTRGGGDSLTRDTIMTESRAQDQDPAETIALNYNEETA